MAGLGTPSYRPHGPSRQPRPAQGRLASTLGVVLLASGLGGCGVMMPLSAWTSTPPAAPPAEDITGAIPKPKPANPAADSDGEVIRRTVERSATAPSPTAPLAWHNPATGNSGTISGLVAGRARNGAACRDFQATVATIGGVRLYSGRACQGYVGPWDLVRFDPADATPAG